MERRTSIRDSSPIGRGPASQHRELSLVEKPPTINKGLIDLLNELISYNSVCETVPDFAHLLKNPASQKYR